ncbi:MAG: competence protein ComEC, partial [Candidatus Aminicenantes bacterium]|nr:competence protein ComEC [Candidatus Aminicenantes bacterium]
TAALCAGIASTEAFSLAAGPPFVLALLAIGAAWALFVLRSDRAAALAALAAVAALGAARFAVFDRDYQANPLHRCGAEGYVDIAGRLARSPGREPDRDVLFLDVRTVTAGGVEKPVRGRLRLGVPFVRGSRPRLDYLAGDHVRASVRLSSGGAFRNFGAFSYERYLQTIGIHRRASTKSARLVIRDGPAPPGSVLAWVSRVRRGIQRQLERRFPAPDGPYFSTEGAVLEALLLGEAGRLAEPTVENLQKTGLYHLFAISGGHIAIINLLLFSLFRLVRMSRRASSVALAVFLVFYTVLVEGSPSVLRATLMTLAFLVGRLLWKDVHVLNTIAASAFALLLANPASLFDIGFELTYAATLTIILFTPPLLKRMPRLPLKTAELAALSVTAALGAAPLVARHFNRVAFSSVILNFPAIPLVGLIMGLGYAFLPFAALFPGAAALPAALLRWLVVLFSRIAHALDAFPFLSIRVATPPAWLLAGYYVVLGLALVRPRFRGQRPAVLGTFALLSLLFVVPPFRGRSPDLRITLIDVGQGESILVEFPGRRTMLIDGGGLAASPFDVGERVVSPVLWRKGLTRVDYLVLTHAHPDHLDGLVAVARNFRIGEFWEGAAAPREGAYAELQRALGRRVVRRRCSRGTRLDVGPVTLEALHPALAADGGAPAAPSNEDSLVIRLRMGRVSVLLTADAGPAAERALLGSGLDLRATVLKAGHHGSAGSTSADFLAAVRPRLVLVSAGEGNTYGFPSPALLARCLEAGAEMARTDLDGAVEIRTDGRALAVRTAAARPGPKNPDFRLTPATKSMIIGVDKRRTFHAQDTLAGGVFSAPPPRLLSPVPEPGRSGQEGKGAPGRPEGQVRDGDHGGRAGQGEKAPGRGIRRPGAGRGGSRRRDRRGRGRGPGRRPGGRRRRNGPGPGRGPTRRQAGRRDPAGRSPGPVRAGYPEEDHRARRRRPTEGRDGRSADDEDERPVPGILRPR